MVLLFDGHHLPRHATIAVTQGLKRTVATDPPLSSMTASASLPEEVRVRDSKRPSLRAIYQEAQRDNPSAIAFPQEAIPEMQVVASSPGSGKSTA